MNFLNNVQKIIKTLTHLMNSFEFELNEIIKGLNGSDDLENIDKERVCSSAGRVVVSKTIGRGFESYRPCK